MNASKNETAAVADASSSLNYSRFNIHQIRDDAPVYWSWDGVEESKLTGSATPYTLEWYVDSEGRRFIAVGNFGQGEDTIILNIRANKQARANKYSSLGKDAHNTDNCTVVIENGRFYIYLPDSKKALHIKTHDGIGDGITSDGFDPSDPRAEQVFIQPV